MARLILANWRERNPTADVWGAWALLSLHEDAIDVEEGFKSACRAVEMSPTSSLGYLGLAKAHLARGNTDEARVAAERVMALNPCENEAAVILSELHQKAGDGFRALAVLALLADRPEANDLVLTAAGELMLNRHPDQIERAMNWLIRAVAIAPHNAEARALKAMGHIITNDLQTGRSELQLALALHPDHPEILYQLVRLATFGASELEMNEAMSYAKRAVALAPGHWRVRLVWSDLLAKRGQYSDAFKVLSDALQIEPESPELWLSLARQAALLGKASVASEALNNASAACADSVLLGRVSREVSLLLGNWKEVLACNKIERQPHGNPAIGQAIDLANQESIHIYASTLRDLLMNARYLNVLKQLCENITLCLPPQVSFMAPIIQGVAVLMVDASHQRTGPPGLDLTALPSLLMEHMDSLPAVGCIAPPAHTVSEILAHRRRHTGPCWFVGPGLDDLLPEIVRSARFSEACVVTMNETAAHMRRFEPVLSDDRFVEVDDWESVCAWMQVADAVIVADDTLAYAAGAQGVSAHVVLGALFDPHWGWNGGRSLWFPSLVLHRTQRQKSHSAWSEISTAIGAAPQTATTNTSHHG